MRPSAFLRSVAMATALCLTAAGCAASAAALSKEKPLALRSVIVSANGRVLGTLFEENRAQVRYADIPQVVKQAVVAIEDARFWEHGALDSRAIVRAFLTNVQEGRAAQGGSTITQQLAKMMYSEPDAPRTFKQKVLEARLAIALQKRYTKEEILTMYLNRAYFGARAYGIVAAAETYFSKKLRELTVAEAALLAGMVKAPTTLDPFTNPRGALQRRRVVLDRMLEERMITVDQHVAAARERLRLRRGTSAFRSMRFPYFVRYIEQEFLSNPAFGKTEEQRAEKLYKGGLRIITTIDEKGQQAAEASVAKTLYSPSDPESALASVQTSTGRIRAMVGGRDFYRNQYNIAAQGQRQPGSAFKPFVLGAALEKGIGHNARYNSSPTVLFYRGERWPVNNYDGRGRGIVTLRRGMEESINGVYARLVVDVGPEAVVDFARRAGITSPLDPFASIALGALTYGVSPLEMASAYATFARNGMYIPPHGIMRVLDPHGKEIWSDRSLKAKRTIDPKVAFTISDVLRGVACRGTARRAMFGRPIAAKTGTTEERKDVWLVGYTPDLSTAVWVGHRRPRPMRTLHGQQVFGGTFGAAIWRGYTERVLAGSPAAPFVAPGEEPPAAQGDCDFGRSDALIGGGRPRSGYTVREELPRPRRTLVPTSSPTSNPTPEPEPTKTKKDPPKPTREPTPPPTESPEPDPSPT